MDIEKLLKYKNWLLNSMTINTIETEFYPYKLKVYNKYNFNKNVYKSNTIRCMLNDENRIHNLLLN